MELLESRPELKGDPAMGILVGKFRVYYEEFDNTVASGKNT